jgi:hypothetical protein
MNARRRHWTAAFVAGGCLGAGLLGDAVRAETGPAGQDKPALSKTLAQTPGAGLPSDDRYRADGEARARAQALASEVPLPDGGNFHGIRWEEAGGVVSGPALEAVLQYNAACQWLRAWHDGREAKVALAVLGDVAAWPALRGTGAAAAWSEVVADIVRGDGPALRGVLADCEFGHAREVAYAERLGLPASR